MTAYDDLLVDLAAGQLHLDSVVADAVSRLGAGVVLATDTPADGWAVVDQLSHLAGFDDAARRSLVDPDAFRDEVATVISEGRDPIAGFTDAGRAMGPEGVLGWWRGARLDLLAAAQGADPKARVPWYGPDMSVMSFVTARVMETWAHGVDVSDALGAPIEVSARLRHVAHIGVGARAFSYMVNGREVPDAPVDVVLTGPDGDVWAWGPGDSADRVEGDAVDFCLLVTQRRHRDDLSLRATGAAAEEWIGIAQAFAGTPGGGRSPL